VAFANLFKIGSTWLYPPDGYNEVNLPVIGYDLNGRPVHQGYPSIVFTWSFMRQEHLTALMDAYDRADPQQEVTYISKHTGGLVTQTGMLEEPVVGARYIVFYQQVAMRVTRLEDV
jgi:hypothetical protein